MKAIFLIRHGSPENSFSFREIPMPICKPDEVMIKVKASGINFADVMIRKNLYEGAPDLPAVIGFDVVGIVEELGTNVREFAKGDRVVAMCKFGGYSEYICSPFYGVVKVPESINDLDALALPVQYLTAYYAGEKLVTLNEGDRVLVHAGSGGLGRALIQYALNKKCTVFSTAGSGEKIQLLHNMGVHYPINYTTTDFKNEIQRLTHGKGVDVVFDGIGGSNARKSFKSLSTGGRLVLHGASALSSGNLFQKLFQLLSFGIYHPVMLMMPSKSILGVNMLELANDKPEFVGNMLREVVQFTEKGIFDPKIAHQFPVSEIARAHALLESRNLHGKACIIW